MNSNGSRIPAGQSKEPLRASGSGSRPQPSLPSFVVTSNAKLHDRPASPVADRQRQAASTSPPFKHWTTASASTDAGCGVNRFGNLAMVGFVIIAIGMAVAAIHQEQRLAPHERQLLQQRR